MTDPAEVLSLEPEDRPLNVVTPADVYGRFPFQEPMPKSFLEIWGIQFMRWLLLAIIVVTGLLAVAWFATRPCTSDVTAILTSADPNSRATAAAHIDALEKLCANHLNNYRDLFQLMVLGGLVPLFTLITGYVFGRSHAQQKPQDEG